MTENNLIQWPRAKYWDRCWNPIVGCKPCSPACEHCYARAIMTERFNQTFEPHESNKRTPPHSGVVFCGNMTDLFGEWVPVRYCHSLFSQLWHFPKRHSGPVPNDATYLFLTKRVNRMCDALRCYTDMPHAYFGFTAENQEWFEKRIEQALDMRDSANKWLSLEPLLGYVDLYPVIRPNHPDWNIKWIVVGCESGPNRRPCRIKWVESIVDQCRAAGVPVFVKQLDIDGKCETDINKFPAHLRIRQVPWAKEAAND